MKGNGGVGLGGRVDAWMQEWGEAAGVVGGLLEGDGAERGYGHTLREIGQQPETWLDTAERALGQRGELDGWLSGAEALLLTGSGSSQFAADCLAPYLRQALPVPVRSVGTGQLIVEPRGVLGQAGRTVVVSLGRSGDSPESCAAVDALLEQEPECRHLVITCNGEGRLARQYRGEERVSVLVLDELTCDRSLVMTSSFTNMVVAGQLLGRLGDGAGYGRGVSSLARMGRRLLKEQTERLAQVAGLPFRSVVYLGDGCRHGAARESALKMLESTAGRVSTIAETFLGLRHGPMCALHDDTLIVAFLSSSPLARAYQMDLLAELREKGLGLKRVLVGEDLSGQKQGDEVVLSRAGEEGVEDAGGAVLDVVTGQLLAFFRSLEEGLRPDWPNEDGVISRVVGEFRIHGRPGVTA